MPNLASIGLPFKIRVIPLSLFLVSIVGLLIATVRESNAIPAFARKYNADCAMCHYPVIPRLNSFGHQFRRAGYRTPIEFNKDQDVTQIGNFFSARIRTSLAYENNNVQTERSEIRLDDVTAFYAGALTRNFSANVHPEFESDGTVLLHGQGQGVFGNTDRFFSVRVGDTHPLFEVGFGGFDRPTGISAPPVYTTSLTGGGVGFALSQTQKFIEFASVQGKARFLAQVLNGIAGPISATEEHGTRSKSDVDPEKDYQLAYEHILDDIASGFTIFYYSGTSRQTHMMEKHRFDFSRLGVNINKIVAFPGVGFFELQGGYIRSYDNVPAEMGLDVEGNAFYVESQQYLTGPEVTFIERLSFIDLDAARADSLRKDYTFGFVTPLQTWVRVAGEYTYTDNRFTRLSGHLATVELQMNW